MSAHLRVAEQVVAVGKLRLCRQRPHARQQHRQLRRERLFALAALEERERVHALAGVRGGDPARNVVKVVRRTVLVVERKACALLLSTAFCVRRGVLRTRGVCAICTTHRASR